MGTEIVGLARCGLRPCAQTELEGTRGNRVEEDHGHTRGCMHGWKVESSAVGQREGERSAVDKQGWKMQVVEQQIGREKHVFVQTSGFQAQGQMEGEQIEVH